jgi:hypothetical protein
MGNITTIGLDLAKNVFQVHAVDAAGSVVVRKRLRRGQVLAYLAGIPPCLIDLEACATAHHWARELLAIGHEARLMPPSYDDALRLVVVALLVAGVEAAPAAAQTVPTPVAIQPAPLIPTQPPATDQFSADEIVDAGQHFFSSISRGLASVIEKAVSR